MKTLKETKQEVLSSAMLLSKNIPQETVMTDPFGIPVQSQYKQIYLLSFEFSSYIRTLLWILGIKRGVSIDVDDIKSFIKEAKLTVNKDQIKKRLTELIENLLSLDKKFDEEYIRVLKENAIDMLDADPDIFSYKKREWKSSLYGEVKAMLWFMGVNEKGLKLKIKKPIIDSLDIIYALENLI